MDQKHHLGDLVRNVGAQAPPHSCPIRTCILTSSLVTPKKAKQCSRLLGNPAALLPHSDTHKQERQHLAQILFMQEALAPRHASGNMPDG